MWWNIPEAREGELVGVAPRVLAVAGTVQKRQRTVLASVPVADVEPNPEQPRKFFDEDKLGELAASIRTRGLLQPVVVRRRSDGGFQLLAGERRFRAAQVAGLDRVPAIVRDGDDPLEIALIENVQREDLAPLEEAEALATLIERHGYSHREVAELLGKSRPYVSNILALNRLPEPVKTDLHRHGRTLSREVLMGIARQETPEAAVALWQRVRLDAMSVRRFRAEKAGESSDRVLSQEVLRAARRLNRTLRRALAEPPPVGETAALLRRALVRARRLVDDELSRLEPIP